MGIVWKHYGNAMGIPWGTLGILWEHHGNAPGIFLEYNGKATV